MRQLNKNNLAKYLQSRTVFLEKEKIPKKWEAIDVGCGNGIFLDHLQKKFKFKKLVGLDIDPEKCRDAQKSNPDIKIIKADAQKIPFADQSFDFVFANALLHHVENRDQAINEMIRVCRSGGLIVLIEPRRIHPLIALLSVLKTQEAGQLKINLNKIRKFLKTKEKVKKVEVFPVNSFIYPYRDFPPRSLYNFIAKLEDLFSHPLISTHQALVINVNNQ